MRFQDDLAYLWLFSEAVLDLSPDGFAVLDGEGNVRAANSAFSRWFGQPGTSLRRTPLLRARVPHAGRPLGDLLRGVIDGSEEFASSRIEEVRDEGKPRFWAVRAAGWDTEDPAYRRVLLWIRPAGDAAAAGESASGTAAVREDRDDRLFGLMARHETLLDHVPLGVCVLDRALRVRAANRNLQEALGRTFRPDKPGDHHVFAVFPSLRDDEFRERLERCRESADPVRGVLSVPAADGGLLEIEVEVLPIPGQGADVGEILLLFHEVRGMSPPSSTPIHQPESRVPAGADQILKPENLQRWSTPPNRRVLLVEKDAWSRMLLSDALRDSGFDDVTLMESAKDTLGRYDPGAFGVILVGLDGDPGDSAQFCRTLCENHPRIPVLALTQRPVSEAVEPVADLPLLGVLGSAGKAGLGDVMNMLYRRPPTVVTAAPGEETARRRYDVIVVGAAEAEVPVLRMLYRVSEMRVRMVFDPDPNAFGLSLAQNLGIPALSGELSMQLETPPDAVVLARPDLEHHLSALDLEGVSRVTPDEIELFLVDPDSFLATDRDPEPPSAAGGDARPDLPPTLGAQALERPPERETGGCETREPSPAPEADTVPIAEESSTAPERPATEELPAAEEMPAAEVALDYAPESPAEGIAGADGAAAVEAVMEAADAAAAHTSAPTTEERFTGEVDSLLGALDLLLDFDRFVDRVLGMALGLTRGVSGSLMVIQDDAGELRIAAARGLPDHVVQKTRQRVGDGVAGRVVESGEPLLLTGAIRDASIESRWDRPDVQSSICAPILSDERVIGVICVNSPSDGDGFGREQLDRVANLGRQVGAALDRSLLLRRMRGRSFELAVRAEVESIVTSEDDPVSRLRRIAGRLVEMLSVDTCGIYLIDPKRDDLVLRASVGSTVRTMDAVAVPLGTGVVGWVGKNLRPAVLTMPPDKSGAACSLAAIPIRHQTDLVGVLAMEVTTGAPFDEERLSILASVAAVIGREVGGLRAHEDSERKVTMLSALSELGLALGAVPERDGLARLVAFSACTVLSCDVASVRFLRDGYTPESRELDHFEMLSAHGASVSEGDPLSDLERRIGVEIVNTGLPCRDNDLPAEEMQPFLERANVSAVLGAPLINDRRELYGTLVVYRVIDPSTGANRFREEEVEIATRLADYATASVQRFATPDAGGDA